MAKPKTEVLEATVIIADLLRTMDPWERANLNSAARAVTWLRSNAPDDLPLTVSARDLVRDALEQALDCIRGETPEDCTPDEAREDTVQKVRDALKMLEA